MIFCGVAPTFSVYLVDVETDTAIFCRMINQKLDTSTSSKIHVAKVAFQITKSQHKN